MSNPHLSPATAAGAASDVGPAWDRGNDQWWDWYMSLADGPAPAGPLIQLAAHDPGPLPTDDAVAAEVAEPYPLTPAQRRQFADESFVKLPAVLTPGTVARLRLRLRELLDAEVDPAVGFQSLEMMWLTDPLVRSVVLSPRLGGISAALLGVERVRLYHDNALSKQPGTGRTPWHYDAQSVPLDSPDVVTAWIPLQPTPREMGPLAFARGAEIWRLVADVELDKHGTSYDRRVAEIFRDRGVLIEDGPYAAGEVSFHSVRCFHTAGPNRTTTARMVLSMTHFRDGVRLSAPTMLSGDWQKFFPGARPGEVAASEHNPVISRSSG